MDWFFNLTHQVLDPVAWKTILSNFRWVDWFTTAFFVTGLLYGIKQGLLREIVEILEAVLVVFVVFHFYKKAGAFITSQVKVLPGKYAYFSAFVVIAGALLYAVKIIDGFLSKLLHTNLFAPLRLFGGAALGVAHVLLLWSLFAAGISLLPVGKMQRAFEPGASQTGHKIRQIAPEVYQFTAKLLGQRPR